MCLILCLTLFFLKVDVVAKEKEVVYDEGSKYVTVFDPLDGSSNVDAGIPTGESHQLCIKSIAVLKCTLCRRRSHKVEFPTLNVHMNSQRNNFWNISS